jgi:hypothetical protein
MQAEFLDTQQVVFTKGLSLETGGEKTHVHFSTEGKLPFRIHQVLGEAAMAESTRSRASYSNEHTQEKSFEEETRK